MKDGRLGGGTYLSRVTGNTTERYAFFDSSKIGCWGYAFAPSTLGTGMPLPAGITLESG